MGPAVGMGLIFGAFLAYLSGAQTIFQNIYTTGDYFPLLFATLAFAIGAASLFNGMMVVKLGMLRLVKGALLMTVIFGVILTLACLIYAGLPPLWLFVLIMFCGFFLHWRFVWQLKLFSNGAGRAYCRCRGCIYWLVYEFTFSTHCSRYKPFLRH